MALVSIRAGHFNLTLQVDYALVGEIPLGSRSYLSRRLPSFGGVLCPFCKS
jgi:hypothetical protein